jgi:hypothetical protein
MKGSTRQIGIRTVAAIIVAVAALALLATQVFAQDVSIDDGSAAVGEEVSVELNAADIGEPGLGAWSIDITFDPDVVSAVACDVELAGAQNVCNPAYADDTVRIAGAAGVGLEGDSKLATITFECEDDGESAIEVNLVHFADGTIGGPEPIDADVTNGTITCGGEPGGLPPTGQGGRSDQGLLYALMGLLAAAGLAIVGRGVLAHRRA